MSKDTLIEALRQIFGTMIGDELPKDDNTAILYYAMVAVRESAKYEAVEKMFKVRVDGN